MISSRLYTQKSIDSVLGKGRWKPISVNEMSGSKALSKKSKGYVDGRGLEGRMGVSSVAEKKMYVIELRVPENEDVMRKIALLNSAMFRFLKVARLKRVMHVDYEGGCIELLVEAEVIDPQIVPGVLTANIREAQVASRSR
jgi:hypothetical protein